MKIRKRFAFAFIVAALIVAIAYLLYNNGLIFSYHDSAQALSQQKSAVKLTEDSFASYLSFNLLVQDLPSNANIAIKTSKNEYIMTRGSVREGKAENPDITVIFPSKYIPSLSQDFCGTLSSALKNGDMKIELHASKPSLGWKYGRFYQYRGCLGI